MDKDERCGVCAMGGPTAMTSVYIVPRETVPGKENRPVTTRYHVRVEYGRGVIDHLGVYATPKLAEDRVRGAREQLARGERPTRLPAAPPPPKPKTTVKALAAEWLETRIDVADNTRKHFKSSIAAIEDRWEETDPELITVADVQAWISEFEGQPGTIKLRLLALAQILDFGEVDPNPARSKRLKKPRNTRKKYRLPTRAELVKLYAALPVRYHGPVKLMEHGGVRVSGAVGVTWGDWDRAHKRVLVDEKTEAGHRWISQIDGLPEMPKRPDGVRDEDRVWPNLTDQAVRHAMRAACEKAKIGTFSPHDLRHLHLSRLLHSGKLSPAQIAERAGHSSPQITLSTYSHVVPPD